ncbi:hypothetical protein EDB89DRAFT_464239 [Lactarius sanguifluus]|nr:hypothetical protein EDB89DRAFT_464239 [Lactarius sanguifluus]
MTSSLHSVYDYGIPLLPSAGGRADADGAASDGGYSSDGDISSIYGAYSRYKTLRHKRWTPVLLPPARRTRTRTQTVPNGSPLPNIHKLPNDVLLEIFTFYGADVFSEPGGHKYWWQTLALVCSKWDGVIRSSPSYFFGELRFGNHDSTLFFQNISHQRGDSVTRSLERSPLLPLNLHYDLICPLSQSSKGDEDDIVVLLRHLERVYSLQLRLSLSTWRKIVAATSDVPVSCTCIEHIYLDTGDRATGFVLPDVFLKGHSPRLRTLMMIGVSLPSLSSLLLSPTRLSCLVLDGIPDLSHLPPRELLVHLNNMPQLRYLNIGFLSTTHHRRLAGDVNPTLDRVALPHLKRFHFRGACTYLESLVTNLDAVAVYELVFTLFHQLMYAIPQVSAFLRRTKRFGFDGVRINFWPEGLVVSASPVISPSPKDVLCLRIPCARLDFQVASAAQICRALRPNFANMEDLFVKYHQNQLPMQWHDGEVDPTLWKELLSQFSGMKTLWISSALVLEVTASMSHDTLRLFEELPILAWIVVETHGDDTSTAAARSLSELLASVRSMGGPVIDVYRLFSDKWKTGTLPGR